MRAARVDYVFASLQRDKLKTQWAQARSMKPLGWHDDADSLARLISQKLRPYRKLL